MQLSQGSSEVAGKPRASLLGLPNELLLKICNHTVPKEYAEITAEKFVAPVFFSLSCKRLLRVCGKYCKQKKV
jgi:hypothetical protein